MLMPVTLAWWWWFVGVSIDVFYYFAEAELVDVIVAIIVPTLLWALPAPSAKTLATLRPPHQALQVPALRRFRGHGAAARESLHEPSLLLCTPRVAAWACRC